MEKIIWIALFFFLCSCNNWTLPSELEGKWSSEESPVSVRTKPKGESFQFTKGTANVEFEIFNDKTASGSIGTASFENAPVKKNPGNPKITGIAYTIKCGSIGKIFDDDPLDSKEVELWLTPIEGTQMEIELRYTEGWAHFPMAGFVLNKELK